MTGAGDIDLELSLGGLRTKLFRPTSSKYLLLSVPKAACSTVKFNLWRMEHEAGLTPWAPPAGNGGIHRKHDNALVHLDVPDLPGRLGEWKMYTVVRNPYTRLLSCYLNKIANDKPEKKLFLCASGRFENSDVSFEEFVDAICPEDSRCMDPHWAPQLFLTQARHVRYDRIASVEAIGEGLQSIVQDAYGRALPDLDSFAPHSTKAKDQLARYYSDAAAKKVYERYRADFDFFGYPAELERALEPPAGPDGSMSCLSGEARLSPAMKALVDGEAALFDEEARQTFAVGALANAGSPDCSVLAARLLAARGELAEAERLARRAVEINPAVPYYHIVLSQILRQRKEPEAAAETMARAAATWPARLVVLREALACARTAEQEAAIAHYQADIGRVKTLMAT